MVCNIHQVRRVAWLLRDRISVDAWLILNQLDQQFSTQPPPDEFRVTAAQDRLNHAIITLSAFGGLVMESMTRGDGWRFLDIGRRLERAIQMVELLRNGLPKEAFGGVGVLEAILEMADSSITYRSRYLTSVQVDLVLDLLLVDEANPRSIAFQLARLREHIGELPGSKTSIRRPAEERMALSLLNTVQLIDVRELARSGGRAAAEAREGLLGKLIADLSLLSEALTPRLLQPRRAVPAALRFQHEIARYAHHSLLVLGPRLHVPHRGASDAAPAPEPNHPGIWARRQPHARFLGFA